MFYQILGKLSNFARCRGLLKLIAMLTINTVPNVPITKLNWLKPIVLGHYVFKGKHECPKVSSKQA